MTDTAIDVEELDKIEKEAEKTEQAEAIEAEPVEEAPAFSTAEQLEPVIAMTFKTLAPNWNVTKAEVEALAASYGECIDYYYPDAANSLPPWLTPLVISAAVIGPRISIPRVKEMEPEKDQVASES